MRSGLKDEIAIKLDQIESSLKMDVGIHIVILRSYLGHESWAGTLVYAINKNLFIGEHTVRYPRIALIKPTFRNEPEDPTTAISVT